MYQNGHRPRRTCSVACDTAARAAAGRRGGLTREANAFMPTGEWKQLERGTCAKCGLEEMWLYQQVGGTMPPICVMCCPRRDTRDPQQRVPRELRKLKLVVSE